MTLSADIESCECDKAQDGFSLTKRFLVDKLLHALAISSSNGVEHNKTPWIQEMTLDDIISTFQLFEESKANATKHLAMHGTSTSKINLALKDKHVCEEEESEEE